MLTSPESVAAVGRRAQRNGAPIDEAVTVLAIMNTPATGADTGEQT